MVDTLVTSGSLLKDASAAHIPHTVGGSAVGSQSSVQNQSC